MPAVQRRPQIGAHRQPPAQAPAVMPQNSSIAADLEHMGPVADESPTPTLDLYQNEAPAPALSVDPEEEIAYHNVGPEDEVLYHNDGPQDGPAETEDVVTPYATSASQLSVPATTGLRPEQRSYLDTPAAPRAMQAHHGEDQEYFMGGGVQTAHGLERRPGKGHTVSETGEVLVDRRTHYMHDEQERAQHRVGAKEGLLVDHEGNAVDTTAAQAPSVRGSEAGKHIFTQGQDGNMMAMDQQAEQGKLNEKLAAEHDSGPEQRRVVHHSTMYAGEAVHGAGDIRAKEGWVQEVSNASGHYQADESYLLDSLDRMDEMGLNLDATRVTEWSSGHAEDAGLAGPYRAARGNHNVLDARNDMLDDIRARGETPAAAENNPEREPEEAEELTQDEEEERRQMLDELRQTGALY